MTERSTLMFVGPIVSNPGDKRNGPRCFHLLNAGGGMLKLDYDSPKEALSARRQILQAKNAHSVSSLKLLQAIQEAIEQAQSPQGEGYPTETDIEDKDAL
jgi:hypothetical protein